MQGSVSSKAYGGEMCKASTPVVGFITQRFFHYKRQDCQLEQTTWAIPHSVAVIRCVQTHHCPRSDVLPSEAHTGLCFRVSSRGVSARSSFNTSKRDGHGPFTGTASTTDSSPACSWLHETSFVHAPDSDAGVWTTKACVRMERVHT